MSKLRSIDLFAGIGGIRLGFDNAFGNDIETVFVSEWDKYAQLTYRENFHDTFEIAGDITKISEKDIPEFDICLAGFPCQAFSLAGKRKGFDDNYNGLCRGTLFLDVARICEYHKPKVIFCENVKGLTIHDKGRTFKIIKQTFEKLGYKVFYEILNSKDFGVPQNRERIYIVAFRNDLSPERFTFPKGEDKKSRISDIIEENPVPAKYYLSDVYLNTLIKHKARHAAKGNGFGYEIRSMDGIAGTLVCGGMGRERNLLIDKRQKSLVPTTRIKGEINREGIRKMTPREWARLQGFPDTFKISLADVHLYKQFGNSVTVNVIEAIAKSIKEVLDEMESKESELNLKKLTKLSGNKGEWSEIYVFLRLLEIGKLYAADEKLNKIDNIFYNIINIIRNESIGTLEFIYNKKQKNVTVIDCNTNNEILRENIAVFKKEADRLYESILTSTGSAFSLEETEKFLYSLGVHTLKAKSSDKSDIKIKIHDINTGYEAIQGFSIKSRLGNASTLINAGKTTNFIYEITGDVDDDLIKKFNSLKTFKEKFKLLKENGNQLFYHDMENAVFKNNIILIDGDLPKIISELLLLYYMQGYSHVVDAVSKITIDNPSGFDLMNNHPFYIYKVKKFLKECALGMLPSKVWDGTVDATGGYIIVREDGEVLCYHIFNINEFENYLLNNTRFETAATKRHGFGKIYKENNRNFIKLNLQIRFLK